ncbi:hypothetical protein F4821DRAFT_276394 [Hypoxylon rubiginosum]|uniref:Uncharacterized protein n=1 Tax=Hypoxylon rubiginosum TaxID=110542 RepID=A0ACC0D909_9PEZI|nr:hypothetical protein F4821DRAFT_276394 [Hypoxylon rubiginosum]
MLQLLKPEMVLNDEAKAWWWGEIFMGWDTTQKPEPFTERARRIFDFATRVGTLSEDLPVGRGTEKRENEEEDRGSPNKRVRTSAAFRPAPRKTNNRNVARKKGAPAMIRPGFTKITECLTMTAIDSNGSGILLDKIKFHNSKGPADLGNLTAQVKFAIINKYDIAQKRYVCAYNNSLLRYIVRRFLHTIHHGKDPEDGELRVLTDDDFKLYELIRLRASVPYVD